MWFILFVGSLFTSSATAVYTPICAEGGLPVCATNGLAYLYFENECRLNAYIYKQIYLGQRVPIRTDLENCLLNCHEIACPALFKPVCAQQVPDGPMRTVPNACLVNQLICATKHHWKIINEGICAPTLKSTSLTHEEYSFTSPLSEGYIQSDRGPISTSYIAPSSYSSSASDSSPLQDPVPAPYEVPQPALGPTTASDPSSYNVPDQSQSYQASVLAPAPIAAPYAAQSQNYVEPTVSVPAPEPCPYAASAANLVSSPYPAPDQTQSYVASTDIALDQSSKYVGSAPALVPNVAPDPVPVPYAAQQPADPTLYEVPQSVSVPYSATDQSTNYVALAPAPAPYAAQAPVSPPYEAPCSNANPAPAPAPVPCATVDQDQNYPVLASDSAPYTTQDSNPVPYEAEQPATYINAAVSSSSPVQSVYGAIEQNPVPYVVPSPAIAANEVPYIAPEQTQTYVAPPPAPLLCAVPDRVPVPYEPQLPSPTVYSSPAAVPVPSQYADQNQGYEAPAVGTLPCADPVLQETAANSYSAPTSYAAAEPIQNYVAPAPAFSSATYTEPVPAPAPCELPQPTQYSNSLPALPLAPYASSDPVSAPAPYEVQQSAPYPYTANDPVFAPAPVPYEAQQSALSTYAATASAAQDQSQGYQAIPSAPAAASYTNLETVPSYQEQSPRTCSCTAPVSAPTYSAQNKYTESATSSPLSNMYSRLPGNLDLTKLFQQLRRRFGIFVYRPSDNP